MNPMNIAAVTGHRECDATRVIEAYDKAYQLYNVSLVHIGMAPGVDLLAGRLADELAIPIRACIPWKTHYKTISKEWRDDYDRIMDVATEIVYISQSEKYVGPDMYHARNRYMVAHSKVLLAYWNGKKSGGTYQTIEYARKREYLVDNLYETV